MCTYVGSPNSCSECAETHACRLRQKLVATQGIMIWRLCTSLYGITSRKKTDIPGKRLEADRLILGFYADSMSSKVKARVHWFIS